MYGNKNKPEDIRSQSKQKNREMLGQLLIQKFRSKFGVLTATPEGGAVENLIQLEVEKLLKQGQTTDAALREVEMKLDQAVALLKDELDRTSVKTPATGSQYSRLRAEDLAKLPQDQEKMSIKSFS